MKIKNLQITSASALDLELNVKKPICVLRGEHSSLALDLLRELIGDCGAENDPDCFDDGHFVIHSDIEMDGKVYSVCYIRNADFMGDNRIAANFVPNSFEFSSDDTIEFMEKCDQRNKDMSNIIYNFSAKANLEGDDRPVFIYVKEKTNEAALNALLDTLASSGRQVFVAESMDYPKINANNVQNVMMG